MDPATAAMIASLGSSLFGAFGSGGEDEYSKYARKNQSKMTREELLQSRNLTKYLEESFYDRLGVLRNQSEGGKLQNRGQDLANILAEFNLGKGRKQWGMQQGLFSQAGDMMNRPAFDPMQNIGNVERSIAPKMNALQSSFAKRGMSGGGGEWAGMSNLQGGALGQYLLGANERSFVEDRNFKTGMLGFQAGLTR